MKAIFSIHLRFFLISMAIVLALGCPTKKTLLSTENTLISCSVELGGKNYNVDISATEPTGSLTLPYGSDLSTLKVVAIKVSDKAKASLSAGSSITVSNNAFTIDVTAEDGSVKNYTITVVVAPPPPPNTEAKILSLSVNLGGKDYSATVSSTATTGTLNLPYGSDLSTLKIVAIKVSDKAKASLSVGSSITVSNNAFTIDVTAEDGSVKNYTITVVVAPPPPPSTEAKILSLSVNLGGKNYSVTVSSTATTGTLTLPYGSDVNAMKVAAIKVSDKAKSSLSAGSSITVSNNAFTIDVTAEDGSVKNYTITVVVAPPPPPNTEAKILSLSVNLGGKNYSVTVSSTATTGTLNLPYGSDVNAMKVATITVSDKANASLSDGSSITVSNNAFTIGVTAGDGTTVNNYTITVVVAPPPPNTEAKIISLSVNLGGKDYSVTVSSTATTGTLTLPYGSDVNAMKVATITVSDKANASLSASSSITVSNKTFTVGVTAGNGTTVNNYTITVVITPPSTETKLLSFQFEKAKNTTLRESSDITFNLTATPTQADVQYIGKATFVPTFSVSTGARVYVNNVEQTSGVSSQDFLNTVTYKVVAQSGATQTYKIAINYTSSDFNVTTGGAISGNNAALTTAVIGEYMNGVRVTQIANDGFKEYRQITKLRIPNSVTSIGDGAFYECERITGDLTIPSSVISIGDYAFNDCERITGDLTIPSSVISIGDYAFNDCIGFSGHLKIPSSVTSIGNNAFEYCNGFTGTLIIPSSVISIGDYAFSNCSGFTGDLSIPNSVKSIGRSTFSNCSGFSGDLSIPSSVTSIGDGAFYGCSGFDGTLIIPSSVTSIGIMAFYGCRWFTGDLIIPSSVKSIGDNAFDGCRGFTKLCNKSSATPGTKAFNGVIRITTGCP